MVSSNFGAASDCAIYLFRVRAEMLETTMKTCTHIQADPIKLLLAMIVNENFVDTDGKVPVSVSSSR